MPLTCRETEEYPRDSVDSKELNRSLHGQSFEQNDSKNNESQILLYMVERKENLSRINIPRDLLSA